MKILAPFDGSSMSESAWHQIAKIAHASEDSVELLSIIEPSPGVVRVRGPLRPTVAPLAGGEPVVLEPPTAQVVETKSQAVEREEAARLDYLEDLGRRLPPGLDYSCDVITHDDPACAIIAEAMSRKPDVIVMTTHGRTGLVHILFGDVAEEVVRSGVAPVLLVHPENVRSARRGSAANAPLLAAQ
jgi:nucleotide-binding universal stress UspA family protein